MNPDTLSALAGVALSALFNYFPGLNTAFDRLTANQQRFAMGVLLALSAVGLALWTCSDPAQGGFGVCLGSTNWRAVVQSFVFALMANQATDRISPKKGPGQFHSTSSVDDSRPRPFDPRKGRYVDPSRPAE